MSWWAWPLYATDLIPIPIASFGPFLAALVVVLIFGAVIIFNAVFNNAGGSVLIIMVMHAANNTISGSFFSPMFTGSDSTRQSWLLAAVWCAAAIAVIIWAGPAHLSRRCD